MKNRKKFWITFLFVCLCGLFVLLAGGVEWGTLECGAGSGFTLLAAWVIAGVQSGGGYY
ncbi:TPA: hypothetical protein ACNRI4_001651 [Escherichia coli]|uniref:hypothetical protein n=1 Tax=Escherichia sp. MOD1-EC5948 TaxID=2093877 RepID=UPI0013003A6F|nr:hypothetical protein [Escherichia sp. MOD1-EC5948]EFA4272498.1 hypothetical protein [Escherichia coli O8]EFM6017036.1 hypothetical protein [Escherichia coli]